MHKGAYTRKGQVYTHRGESGYTVRIMRFSQRSSFESGLNALSMAKIDLQQAGKAFLDMSANNPTHLGLRHELALLAHAFGAPQIACYDPDPRGILSARESLAAHLCAGRGISSDAAAQAAASPVDPERLYLCASTSEAYGWLFKLLCDPGDRILVPRPGYPLFDHLAGLEGVQAQGYLLDYSHPAGWNIDIDALREAIEAPGAPVKAIVLVNPNNPTGAYVQTSEREAIVELCARHAIALIVDEVFFGFPLEARAARASFLGEDRVLCFVLDGLSKRLCLPQAKLGWIALSGPRGVLASAMGRLDIIADAYLSVGAPVMCALPSLLDAEAAFGAIVRARLALNLASYRRILEYADSPHRLLRVEGGWTALVESPRYLSEEALAVKLVREAGLFLQPGYFFDMDHEPHFAFSLLLDPQDAIEGAETYRRFFDGLACRTELEAL